MFSIIKQHHVLEPSYPESDDEEQETIGYVIHATLGDEFHSSQRYLMDVPKVMSPAFDALLELLRRLDMDEQHQSLQLDAQIKQPWVQITYRELCGSFLGLLVCSSLLAITATLQVPDVRILDELLLVLIDIGAIIVD